MKQDWNTMKTELMKTIENSRHKGSLPGCLGLDPKHEDNEEPIWNELVDELNEQSPDTLSGIVYIVLKHSPAFPEFAYFLSAIMRATGSRIEREAMKAAGIESLIEELVKG